MLSKREFLERSMMAATMAAFPAAGIAQGGQLSVVATTGMIADTARQIGGDLVGVRGLMGPGVDPHSYRQTRSDIVAMTRADLVLWHGLYLEAQMEEFFGKLSAQRNVVAVADTLSADQLITHATYAGRNDPHVWMSPVLWSDVTATIRDTLISARPENGPELTSRWEAFDADLQSLHRYAADVLATIPKQNRVLVTAHDAFSYFGREYDFEVLGIQGISTQSEAGLKRIADLVDVLVERKLSAVFVESSVSDRSMRALIEGAASRGHSVRIGGELYSDAMGVDGTYEGTYLGMIDHNVTTIARALGGAVPPRGMSGQLTFEG